MANLAIKEAAADTGHAWAVIRDAPSPGSADGFFQGVVVKKRIQRYVGSVVFVFVSIVALQVLVATLSISLLSSVRAYVAGESLYSKAQKDALLHLSAYASSSNEADYDLFLDALRVPEGDAKARRALQRSEPDLHAAREGFVAGQNDPEDIDGLIRLFVWAQDLPFMARAISVWAEGDKAIAELRARAALAHEKIRAGLVDDVDVKGLGPLIAEMNQRLTPLEYEFSQELGRASRSLQKVLLVANLLIAASLCSIGAWYIRNSLRAQRRRDSEMRELFSSVSDSVIVVNANQRILLFNRSAERLFGCKFSEAKAAPIQRFIPAGLPAMEEGALPDGAATVYECEGLGVDGRAIQLEASLSPLNASTGLHAVLVCRDVTERWLAREKERLQMSQRHVELELKAYTDPLTGLPNREALESHLETALSHAQRNALPIAVLFLDLDGFKSVNDNFGHLVGDELLKQVSERLRGAIRGQDEVFRISGDEFVVAMLEDLSPDTVQAVAKRIVAAIRAPFSPCESQVCVTVSVGFASYPEDGRDTRSLLLAADASMYRAKKRGKNRLDSGLSPLDLMRGKPQLLTELERAVENGEFDLHYQPIVRAGDGGGVGAEALIRWQHPARGLLEPSVFMPQAESYGMGNAIWMWVLHRAIQQLSDSAGEGPLWVTVNLAASQLLDRALPDRINQLMRQTGSANARLGVELTESLAMRDIETSHEVLQGIREAGVFICLDDFGTGYSSLSHLHRMPIDKVKIDRSFVERLTEKDGNGARIVSAITALSHSMDLTVVAEGVTTISQVRSLRGFDVDELQGFGIASPMPWDDLVVFSRKWVLDGWKVIDPSLAYASPEVRFRWDRRR